MQFHVSAVTSVAKGVVGPQDYFFRK